MASPTTSQVQKKDQKSLKDQYRDLSSLFDRVTTTAITIGAKSQDPSDHITAHTLDDHFFELRILIENIGDASGVEPSLDILKMMEHLKGEAASAFREVLKNLETDLEQLLAESVTNDKSFSEDFRVICNRVKALIDRLDKLQEALLAEFVTKKEDICNIVKEEGDARNHSISALCFDGGGIRSYSSILILKALMDEISLIIKGSEENLTTARVRPSEVIRYIFGSSSGGLIAIMLGRLNMSDEECLDTFRTYAGSIFGHRQLGWNIFGSLYKSKYSEKTLSRATKLVVGSFDPSPEAQKWKRDIFAAPENQCRCAVFAYARPVDGSNIEVPYIFRTYDNRSGLRNPGKAGDCQIWQAARATAAAPLYFSPVKINGSKFLDGGFGANNPSHEALVELSTLHPESHTCLISIGSGKPQAVSRFKTGPFGRLYAYAQAAVRLATDTESVHETMVNMAARSENFVYFRFNVPGLESIAMDEWTAKKREQLPSSDTVHTIEFIRRRTSEYLAQADTRTSIQRCAQKIVQNHGFRRKNTTQARDKLVQSGLVPARNNLFHGREGTLQRMYEHLKVRPKEHNSRLRTCILYGLGGIGKTQIAIEYVYKHMGTYDFVFWVRGSTEHQLADSYGSIAKLTRHESDVESQDASQDVQRARHWLSSTEATWLLVFDDITETKSIMSYIPASTKGFMIITSRRRDVDVPGSLHIAVEPLDSQSGASLLKSIIQDQEVGDSAEEISKLLGGLPLAIVTAGAYISMTSVSPIRYLQSLKDRYGMLISDVEPFTTWQYEQTLQTVFDHTLAALPTDARTLLEYMAFLSPEDIPEELFCQEKFGRKFEVLQTELLRNCLIQRDGSRDPAMLGIHRILKADVLRRLLSDPGRYQAVLFKVCRLMRAVVPHLPSDLRLTGYSNNRLTFAMYLPHVLCLDEAHAHCDPTYVKAEDNLEYAGLLFDVGLYLSINAPFDKGSIAKEMHLKVLKIRTSLLGQENPETLAGMANLALTYRSKGQWAEAERLQVQVLEARKRILGAEHPDTLISLANLALYYSHQGRLMEAEQLDTQVMEIRKRLLGPEHPHTLASMANLASTYRKQGRLTDAEQLEVQIMETRERSLGIEHPDTLASMHSLALIYSDQGRLHESEELSLRALKASNRVLGEHHPVTLSCMTHLALTYNNQGRWKEAEELETQILELSTRLLGIDHPDTLTSMANLAVTYRNQGRLTKAEQLDLRVIEPRKRVLGSEHPETLDSMTNLASTYRYQGRLADAEQLEVQIMEIRKRSLGIEHPDTLASMHSLALTYSDQQRWAEAEQLEAQVMEMSIMIIGPDHPATLNSIDTMAMIHSKQGRLQRAEQLSVQVMKTRNKVLGRDHPATLTSMHNLAQLYCDQGRLKEAEELANEVKELRKLTLGDEHPETLTSISSLASIYRHQGRLIEAGELSVQALEMRKRVLGNKHPATLASMHNLAQLYCDQGRLKEAEELAKEVMELRRLILGDEHPETLTSISSLASIYRHRGRLIEAGELSVQALEMRKRVLGNKHPATLASMHNLAQLYCDQGRLKEAEELAEEVMELRQRILGAEHPDTLASKRNLVTIYSTQGRLTEAENLGRQVAKLE